jgi:hypothetical protein
VSHRMADAVPSLIGGRLSCQGVDFPSMSTCRLRVVRRRVRVERVVVVLVVRPRRPDEIRWVSVVVGGGCRGCSRQVGGWVGRQVGRQVGIPKVWFGVWCACVYVCVCVCVCGGCSR